MENNKLERLRAMLQQVGAQPDDIASSGSLESMSGAPGGATRGLAPADAMPGELEAAPESLDLLLQGRTEEIDTENLGVLEAIVMPLYRPVVDITDGHMVTAQLSNKWRHLGEDEPRRIIESTFKSIGRIEIPHHPILPYAGTGFVVGKSADGRGILMTNRHVAEIFATGIGVRDLQFHPGQTVAIDFLREYGRNDSSNALTVEKVLMIHPFWDMALLQVVGLGEAHEPLKLSVLSPEELQEREVVTVGYPGYDPGGDFAYQNTQNRIFRGVYYVKRLQPGLLKSREEIESFNKMVPAVTHDCSTLGGNSGSAVLVLPKSPGDPIEVIGLHFAGAYLRANYAVPTYDLASDARIVDTGIDFSGTLPPTSDVYGPYWSRISSERPPDRTTPTAPPVVPQAPSGSANRTVDASSTTYTWKIPLEVSITLGPPELTPSIPSTVSVTVAPEEGLFSRPPELTFAEITAMFSSTSLAADEFDWQTALSLAVASSVAYQSQAVVEATAKNSWRLTSCKFIEVDDTQCFIASSSDRVLISFRGTTDLRDWLANLNAFSTTKPYGSVHRGFYYGFEVVKPLLEEALDQLAPSKVLLTGHSLGGALATVAAAEWAGSYPIAGVYTFGQPAVGKGIFSTFFNSHYSDDCFRFVNDDDIVPRVPPTYRHIGKLYHFDAQGGLAARTESLAGGVNGGESEMMTEAEFDYFRAQLLAQQARQDPAATTESLASPALEGLFPSVSDHSLSAYIRKIKAKTA